MEQLIQPHCSEGDARFNVVQGYEDGLFTVCAKDVICKHHHFELKLILSCSLDAKGIHLCVLDSEEIPAVADDGGLCYPGAFGSRSSRFGSAGD
jgi:hypothetical protein